MNLKQKFKFLLPYFAIVISMALNLRSKDQPTRWMSLLFLVSLFGLICVPLTFVVHLYGKAEEVRLKKIALQVQLEGENHDFNARLQEGNVIAPLGTLLIDLQSTQDPGSSRRIQNVAQIEVHLRCDSLKTKALLLERLPQVKDMILTVLMGVDREDLQSQGGKRRLRSLMMQKINAWIPFGKVEDVFLSNLLFV